MLEIFRNRLKIARNSAGLSQVELAQKINSTRSTVSGYEADGKEPDYNTLLKMCHALDVSADYLLGLTDNPSHKSDAPSSDPLDKLRRASESLSRDGRASVSSILSDTCSMIAPDVDAHDVSRLRLYARLSSVLSSQRSAVRTCIEKSGGTVDVSSMAEIMSLQSELKSTVSAILDQLLQADLESVAKRKGGDIGYLNERAM